MSQMRNKNNGKWPTAADLENAFIKMQNNLENMNKTFINKMLKTLNSIMVAIQHNESGVLNVILKWFRLYLNVHISINPDNKKLLKYYESSVPTIITYIIGCLQYKIKELPNYHYNLLEILEELLENVPPKILNEIKKFEIGTIGCLWNPIDIAGDFNTQSKALKILSILLKQFDDVRQNEELKCIKWTNLNLFQDKLKTVVQESKLSYIQENSTRELLNNYNMNLSKKILVYSFCCTSAVMDNKYTFYKPLNLQQFWIDINYSPKTLSYKARFKLNSKSKYENINVILKVQMMKLENNIFLVYFKAPGEFSKYSNYFLNVTNNVIQFTLTNEEVQRLHHNNYIMEYFNSLNESANVKPIKTYREDRNILDSLKNEMSTNLQENKSKMPTSNRGSNLFKKSYNFLIDSTPEQNMNPENTTTSLKSLVESPKSSRNVSNEIKKHPIRKLRNRNKFFTSLIMDDTDNEIINKTAQRKKTKNRKPRQTKSRDKQVCKVTPTVDLTKIENIESIKQNIIVNTIHKDETPKKCSPLITTQDCAEVLKQVADIYDVGDTTYAKPCQSYRNFKTQPNPVSQITNVKGSTKTRNRKKKVDKIDNESSVEKIRKLTNSYAEENKENINPQNPATDSKIPVLAKTKSILSPHLFETQCSDEAPPTKKLPSTIKTDQNLDDADNLVVDLTLDEQNQNNDINNENVSSCDSIECEDVRGINENSIKDLAYICTPTKSILYNSSELNTPRPSCMNISDVNDSDMEITQVANNHNFIMDRLTENNHHEHNVIQQTNDLDMDISNANPNNIMERKNTANQQTDYENMEVPIYLEQILNDFEYNSDDTFDSSHKTQTKQTNVDIMANNNDSADHDYYRDCVIFQKRIDEAEDSGSSEDDGNFNESTQCQKNSKRKTNHNLAYNGLQNKPLYLNQNLCQQNTTWATPDKTNNISTNLTTTMATKCQVTPTAIIMHQIQVSDKKSVILRNKKPRKAIKANKSLNGYFQDINSNTELIKLRKEAVALQNQNSYNFQEITSGKVLPLTDNKASSNNTNNKPANLPIALHNQLSKLMYRNGTFNSTINANNLYETPSTNPPTQTQYNEDFEKNSEQRSSPCTSNTTEDSNDTLYNFIRPPLENAENSFKSDLLQILNDFKTNMQLRLNNAHHLCLKNATALYNQKFCEIAQGVLKKSEEQRIELDEIRSNIGRLVRELEWQYDKFINKSKQFDVHKEITERVLESLTNTDIPNLITNDYEELIKQLNIEQNNLVQKVWQTYVEKHKN